MKQRLLRNIFTQVRNPVEDVRRERGSKRRVFGTWGGGGFSGILVLVRGGRHGGFGGADHCASCSCSSVPSYL